MYSLIDVYPIKDHVKEILKSQNLKTDLDFLAYSMEELIKMTSLDINELEKVKSILTGDQMNIHTENALICLGQCSVKNIIPTFSTSIDELLDGGFHTGRMYQLYGEPGSGKSQLCYQIASNVQIPKLFGGYEASTIYIDTENSFAPSRFFDICLATIEKIQNLEVNHSESVDLSTEKMLSNLFLFRCNEPIKLSSLILYQLEEMINEKRPKLIIVDSIAYQFRLGYEDVDYFKSRSLIQIAQKLKYLAFKYDLCMICVNQVSCDLDKQQIVPTLGRIWNHSPTAHLKFSIVHSNIRSIQGDKSCYKKDRIYFKIQKDGIRDLDEQISNQLEDKLHEKEEELHMVFTQTKEIIDAFN